MSLAWMTEKDGGVVLRLVIQPKASRTEVIGPHGEPPRLKVRVAAPPVEGAANEELTRFLAKALGVAPSRIELLRGASGKQKDVFCPGLSAKEVACRITPALVK